MGKRAGLTTQDYIIDAELPEQTDSYTVISHEAVIKKTKEVLAAHGLEIERELYRCNQGAKIAQGIYHLKYKTTDPDIGLMFCWNNSYDKSMRFRCSIGGYVHKSLASIIGGNMGSWGRKHTGSAYSESLTIIEEQITGADTFFKELIEDKDKMKLMVVDKSDRASFIGRLYLKYDLLTTEQISQIKYELKNSTTDMGSIWEMYNAIIVSLQKAHPRTWMDQQRMAHYLINEQLILRGTMKPMVFEIDNPNPAQLNIPLDIIPEEEEVSEPIVEPEKVEPLVEPLEEVTIISPVYTESVDNSWPCLDCQEKQEETAPFYEGQLCEKCYQLKTQTV